MHMPDALLGRLYVEDVNMPWFYCKWEPTEAFAALEPQFREARKLCEESDAIPNPGVDMMDVILEENRIWLLEIGEGAPFKNPIRGSVIWLTKENRMNFTPGFD